MAVAVQVAKADASVAPARNGIGGRCEDRFPVDFQSVEQRVVFDPPRAVEGPRLCHSFISDQRADATIGVDDSPFHAGLLPIPLLVRSDQRDRKTGVGPFLFLRIPNARLEELLVGANHIQTTVIIQIQQSHAIVLAVARAQRVGEQKVLVEPFLGFAKVEELHLAPVFFVRMVDELNQLLRSNPAVRMEDEGERALLQDTRVERRFPVGDRHRVVRAMGVVRLPIARRHRGKFPAQFADDVGIRVILNRGAEPFQAEPGDGVGGGREIFPKLFAAVRVEHQFARQ